MSKQRDVVRDHMAQILGVGIERIDDDLPLVDLVHSSFMLVEMVIDLQEAFDVRFGQAEMKTVKTVGQLLDLITRLRTTGPQLANAG